MAVVAARLPAMLADVAVMTWPAAMVLLGSTSWMLTVVGVGVGVGVGGGGAVVVVPRAAATAAPALTMPEPHPTQAAGNGVAVLRNKEATPSGVRLGLTDSTSAATPLTTGVAIDVPM